MEAFGNFKKGILNIGEAPGEAEDRVGKPWQGRTGKLLEKTYASLGIDLFEDCLNINAINCHPEDNRTPDNYEIDCCRKIVLRVIDERKPKLIIALGNSAIYSLFGRRWKKDLGGISKWRGWTIPDQDLNAWVCPTFHPSYVERENAQEVDTIWKDDLKQAFELVAGSRSVPFPVYKEPHVEFIADLSRLRKEIPSGSIVAFDYETTGLKPHATGHRVVCASVATSGDHAYTFFIPDRRKDVLPFIELLKDPTIGKMAHNMKFEEAWSSEIFLAPVQNWEWDSMLAAHLLDNRQGITGLKFQTFVNFGVVDYASEISPYLHSVDQKDGNAFNQIDKLLDLPGGREKLLMYCALDSIFEYKLAMVQRSEIILPF